MPLSAPVPHALNYLNPSVEAVPKSISVLSALAMSLGFFGFALFIGALISGRLTEEFNGHNVKWAESFIVVGRVTSIVLFLALFIGGVAGMRRRLFARKWLVTWSVVDLAWLLIKCAGNCYLSAFDNQRRVEFRALLDHSAIPVHTITGWAPASIDITINVIVLVVLSILPLSIWICWRRPNVIAAFQRRAGGSSE